MLWRGRRGNDNVVDQRKFGAGSMGIGGLVIGALVYTLRGGNPLAYVAMNANEARMSNLSTVPSDSGVEVDKKKFASAVLAHTEDVWTTQFSQHSATYKAPKMVLFRGRTKSGSGPASSAVGDDKLQRLAGGEVQPERFTHGSSAQRTAVFQQGLNVGKLESCLR